MDFCNHTSKKPLCCCFYPLVWVTGTIGFGRIKVVNQPHRLYVDRRHRRELQPSYTSVRSPLTFITKSGLVSFMKTRYLFITKNWCHHCHHFLQFKQQLYNVFCYWMTSLDFSQLGQTEESYVDLKRHVIDLHCGNWKFFMYFMAVRIFAVSVIFGIYFEVWWCLFIKYWWTVAFCFYITLCLTLWKNQIGKTQHGHLPYL